MGGGWELLGSPSVSRMGLGPCGAVLTHAPYCLRAPGPRARREERSMVLLRPASERTLMVPKGEGRKQDGLGGIALNIGSKQLHAIISLKDVACCRVDAQQYGSTYPVSSAYLIALVLHMLF